VRQQPNEEFVARRGYGFAKLSGAENTTLAKGGKQKMQNIAD
jgi:hypothetical protein